MAASDLLRGLVTTAILTAAIVGVRAPAGAVLYLTESFQNATAAAGFEAGGGACLTSAGTAATNVPQCAAVGANAGGVNGSLPDPSGEGALRLTNNAGNQSGFVIYTVKEPSSAGLQAIFNEYSYDTTSANGADGISFFFLDADYGAAPTIPGAFGGSLGYSQRTTPSTVSGIGYGYLGIGLDEYGNFSNPTEGRDGGPGAIAETVGIRGACVAGANCANGLSGTTAYPYVTGYHNAAGNPASLAVSIDTPAATIRPNVNTRRWRITLTTALTIEVDLDTGSGFTTIIPATSVSSVNGTAFPTNFYFGFASSTGGSTNIHEVTALTLQAANVQYGVVTGPASNPFAVGSYDGSQPVNDFDDFTERSFTPPSATSVYKAAAGTPGSTYTAAVPNIAVPHQLNNQGNVADTYTVSDKAPAGWTVQIFPDSGGAAGINAPGTTPLTGSAVGATSTGTTPSVAGSATYTYWTVYTAPAGVTTFTRFDAPITVASTTVTAASNTTHDELYSGFIGTVKSVAVTASNCPAGETVPATGVCSGGTMAYTIAYSNIALGGGTNNTETNLTPDALLSTNPGTLKITEDGALGTNNWATFTTGLQAGTGIAPADSTAGTTFAYGPAPGAATLTAGQTRFVDTVGGANFKLLPQATGTITFSLKAK